MSVDILELETAYWDAVKAKDGEKVAALSGELSIVTGERGVRALARDRMAAMTGSGDWELLSYRIDEVELAQPSPDVAIIAYRVRQKMRIGGEEHEFEAADSSTWVRGEEGWQCHAHSEAVLAPEAASA